MHGCLFDQIVSMENLEYAHKKASRGKAHYREVQWVNANKEAALLHIQYLLITGQFKTSEYTVEEALKGDKIRTIHKLPYYPDRIVQHAIVNVCGPFWIKSMIRDTFQSIPGRGTLDCFRRTRHAIQTYKPTYAMKLDINKFYPSAKPEHILQPHIFRIKCKRTFNLLSEIISSLPFLPLGNHTSQYAGNLLLSPVDWYVKQKLGIKHYFRYCDDIVIMHDSKQTLKNARQEIEGKLASIELTIKPDLHIRDLRTQPLDFVGYRISHEKTLLRKSLASRFVNACKTGKSQAMPSYWGWIKHANALNLWYRNTGSHQWKPSSISNCPLLRSAA
jgi:hypothetical protein